MLVTINENKQVNVTIQGGTMTVELERGNFVLEDAVNTECDFETEEDYARLTWSQVPKQPQRISRNITSA